MPVGLQTVPTWVRLLERKQKTFVAVTAFQLEKRCALACVVCDRVTRASAVIVSVVWPGAESTIDPTALQPVIAHVRQNVLANRRIRDTRSHADRPSGAL
jgi:hypothetical protein